MNAGAIAANFAASFAMNNPVPRTAEKTVRFNDGIELTGYPSPAARFDRPPNDHAAAAAPGGIAGHAGSNVQSPVVYDGEASDRAAMPHQRQLDSVALRQIAHSVAQVATHGSRPAEALKPEQTIQVTFGRIEVRAVQPPSSAKAERPRSALPVMSLDDYLQQRSKMGSGGGGR